MSELKIPSWDETFMRMVYEIASRSKDTRTKIGAVLVRDRFPIMQSYNGMAIGVNDSVLERYERPTKYSFFQHAEAGSIFLCARNGICSKGATVFTQGVPCNMCAIAIVQGGIKEVVVHKQWMDCEKEFPVSGWRDTLKYSLQMLEEAGVSLRIFDKVLGMQGMMDGQIVNV